LPRRLGIIGTFVWDTIWTLEDQAAGRPLESWGGVSFSVASAAATRADDWEIVPIAHVGSDLVDPVHAYLDTMEGIGSRAGIVPVDHPNNRVELVYTDQARRGETMRGGVPGWRWPELAPLLEGVDALYVNFLSGWELDLATAKMLRRFPGFVYCDLHSLFLGPPRADGPRLPRILPRWGEWLRCFHAVQMNEDEYELLVAEPLAPETYPEYILGFGARAAFVTQGERGASFAARPRPLEPRGRGNETVERGSVPAHPVAPGGDPTGAGDAWGAALVGGLVSGVEVRRAIARANAVAAVKMRHRGGSGLYEHLRDHRHEWEGAARDD